MEELVETNDMDYSREFKRHLQELTAEWKNLLKRNKKVLLKCPNYTNCQYKCSSIGGMQYHYPRCAGACPVFKCHLCGREYESRTGLNYHNASHHTGMGVVLNPSENGKRSQRREKKPDNMSELTEEDPPTSLPIVQVPTSPTITSSIVPQIPSPTISFPPLSLPLLPVSTYPHILPSLLKHSTSNNPQKPGKGRRGGRHHPGKSARSNSLMSSSNNNNNDVVSLEGVVKSPGGTDKKIVVTIPSIEYPDEYRPYLPDWRDQLKNSQMVQCPNYDQCQFQCTTVNGMKYHFIRCQKDKLPEFSCSLCNRSFHCRSGLVWHLKNTHKLADLPTNQKTVEVTVPKKESSSNKEDGPSRRGRKRKNNVDNDPEVDSLSAPPSTTPTSNRKSPRKNDNPRPTAKFYLKYLETQQKPVGYSRPSPTAWVGSPPPTPKLHPPSVFSPISSTEFTISEPVPTDQENCGSIVMEYPEEVLTQWHKWYSSDSEEDYDDEGDEFDEDGGEGLQMDGSGHTMERKMYDFYSSSSDESSDEDYTGYSYPKGRGRGRGRGRGKKKTVDSSRSYVPPIPSLLSVKSKEPVNPVNPVKLKPQVPKYSKVETVSTDINTASSSELSIVPPQLVKTVKPVKPVKLISTEQQQQQPIKPPKLVSVVSPVKAQQSSNTIVALSPGNYYQVQSIPPPNLVPIQLVSPVQNSSYQMSPGGLVLIQQPGSQPQYATLHTSSGSPQKVSVIMNPRTVTLTAIANTSSSSSTTRGRVISQFDGPKERMNRKRGVANPQELDDEFERVRKKARQGTGTTTSPKNKKADIDTTNNQSSKKGTVKRTAEQKQSRKANIIATSSKKSVKMLVDSPKEKGSNVKKRKDEEFAEHPVEKKPSCTSKKGPAKRSEKVPDKEGGVSEIAMETIPSIQTTDSTPKKGKAKRGSRNVQCPECKEEFSNQRACTTHKETTHLPVSPEATIAERASHWRISIKKHKYVKCDRCLEYRAKSVTAMKYHYERCGHDGTGTNQVFLCSICDKQYSSQPGLRYHLKYHHTEPDISRETSPVVDPVLSVPPSRKAADKANKKMHEISQKQQSFPQVDLTSIDTEPAAVVDSSSSLAGVEQEGGAKDSAVSKETLKKLRETLSKEGVVACPKGCGQTYTTFPGLDYHLKNRHQFAKQFRCPKCRAVLSSRKRIINHMTKKHPQYEVDDYNDLEYIAEEGDSESEGDEQDSLPSLEGEEEEKKVKVKVEERRLPPLKMFGTTSYRKIVEILKDKHLSKEPLFSCFRPRVEDYEAVPQSELDKYLPQERTSIRFDDCPPSDSDGGDVTEEKLDLFKTSSSNTVFFTGGPVWSVDWLPYPVEQEQERGYDYIALSAYRKLLEVNSVEGTIEGNGLIQFWCLQGVTNESDSPLINFSFGICHNWGVVRDIKWCPSGTIDQLDSAAAELGYLPRLGLLALACTDGQVRILSVPHPSSVSTHSLNSELIIRPTKIAALLQPHQTDIGHFGQCFSVDWLPANGHSKIAGGFGNGSVIIWNLKTNLPFLSCSSPSLFSHCLFTPTIILPGLNGPCRSVSWLPSDSNFLFSAGHDKACSVWDIRQPHQPLCKIERANLQLKTIAPLVWASLLVLEDSLTRRTMGSLYTPMLFTQPYHVRYIPTPLDPIASVGYSHWGDCVSVGSYGGEVQSVNLEYNMYYNVHWKRNKSIMDQKTLLVSKVEKLTTPSNLKNERASYHAYAVDELVDNFKIVFYPQQAVQKANEDLYSNDVLPLSAVTSLSWSPHSNSHRWLVCGLNCGLVKIIRTKK